MWRDKVGHVIAHVAQGRLALPAWRLRRANRNGATKATCRASTLGTTKRAMGRKLNYNGVKFKILLKKVKKIPGTGTNRRRGRVAVAGQGRCPFTYYDYSDQGALTA